MCRFKLHIVGAVCVVGEGRGVGEDSPKSIANVVVEAGFGEATGE